MLRAGCQANYLASTSSQRTIPCPMSTPTVPPSAAAMPKVATELATQPTSHPVPELDSPPSAATAPPGGRDLGPARRVARPRRRRGPAVWHGRPADCRDRGRSRRGGVVAGCRLRPPRPAGPGEATHDLALCSRGPRLGHRAAAARARRSGTGAWTGRWVRAIVVQHDRSTRAAYDAALDLAARSRGLAVIGI
jgi:hypothetical protein